MNEHAKPSTLSERADELEEQMMHELGERIATKSVLFNMADGKVEMQSGPALKAANPDKYFLMGADSRLPAMPEKTDADRFLQVPVRVAQSPAAKRDPRTQGRPR